MIDFTNPTDEQLDEYATRVNAAVAANPAFWEEAKASFLAAVEEFKLAHAALGLAIAEFSAALDTNDTRSAGSGGEALNVFRMHLGVADGLATVACLTAAGEFSEGGQ